MDAVDGAFYMGDDLFFDRVNDLTLDVAFLLDDSLAVDWLAVHVPGVDLDLGIVGHVSMGVVVDDVVYVDWHVYDGFYVMGNLAPDDRLDYVVDVVGDLFLDDVVNVNRPVDVDALSLVGNTGLKDLSVTVEMDVGCWDLNGPILFFRKEFGDGILVIEDRLLDNIFDLFFDNSFDWNL